MSKILEAARRGAERAKLGSTRQDKKSLPAMLEELKDAFLELLQKLSRPAPAPNVTVHPPVVNVQPPNVNLQAPSVQPVFKVLTPTVSVHPERKTAWTFEIVERDNAGLIKKFTATPK